MEKFYGISLTERELLDAVNDHLYKMLYKSYDGREVMPTTTNDTDEDDFKSGAFFLCLENLQSENAAIDILTHLGDAGQSTLNSFDANYVEGTLHLCEDTTAHLIEQALDIHHIKVLKNIGDGRIYLTSKLEKHP